VPADFGMMKRVADAQANIIDVIAYPFITDLDKILEDNPIQSWGKYTNRLKLGGVKITGYGNNQGGLYNFSIQISLESQAKVTGSGKNGSSFLMLLWYFLYCEVSGVPGSVQKDLTHCPKLVDHYTSSMPPSVSRVR
jgi:hypothetical protein